MDFWEGLFFSLISFYEGIKWLKKYIFIFLIRGSKLSIKKNNIGRHESMLLPNGNYNIKDLIHVETFIKALLRATLSSSSSYLLIKNSSPDISLLLTCMGAPLDLFIVFKADETQQTNFVEFYISYLLNEKTIGSPSFVSTIFFVTRVWL